MLEEISVLKCKHSEDEAPKFSVSCIIGFVNKCAFIYACVLAGRAVYFTLSPVVFVQIQVKKKLKKTIVFQILIFKIGKQNWKTDFKEPLLSGAKLK